MNALFKKLNYKGESQIVCLNHPESFASDLVEMAADAKIVTSTEDAEPIEFAIAFATKQSDLDKAVASIASKISGDATLWFCYPKSSSKKYTCDFNRDTGWAKFGDYKLEPVRQVAINEDWSALRFRNVAFIKTLTRSKKMALSEEAKRRTSGK
jgi:hypothetical protein